MENIQSIVDAFVMGLELAKHLDPKLNQLERANEITNLLNQVAKGDLALVESTADAFSNFPKPVGLVIVDPEAVEQRINQAKEEHAEQFSPVVARQKQIALTLLVLTK